LPCFYFRSTIATVKPTFLVIVAGAILSLPSAHAQLIASFNADTLSPGSVTTWNDLVANGPNATVMGAQAANINQSVPAAAITTDPTAANTNSTFNGHAYVDFGTNQGLATASSLFSGGADRSVAAVYDDPAGDNHNTNPIAGQGDAGGNQGAWFVLQARDTGANNGDPYLAGYNDDVNPLVDPVANQLTFAIGTYSFNATTQVGTETLYWAYGLTGTVHSQSMTLGTALNPNLNTAANPFTIGFDSVEGSLSDMQIGAVQVYSNSMDLAQATTTIDALQAFYAAPVPEPSTYALMGVTLLAGVVFLRRRAQA
jgi:hypothetical protein